MANRNQQTKAPRMTKRAIYASKASGQAAASDAARRAVSDAARAAGKRQAVQGPQGSGEARGDPKKPPFCAVLPFLLSAKNQKGDRKMENTRKDTFCGTQKAVAEKLAAWRYGSTDRRLVNIMLDYIQIQRGYTQATHKPAVFRLPGTDIWLDVTPRKMAIWRA